MILFQKLLHQIEQPICNIRSVIRVPVICQINIYRMLFNLYQSPVIIAKVKIYSTF